METQLSLTLSASRPRRAKHRNYYDTTPLSALKLHEAIQKAETQDAAVLALFRCMRRLAPSQCLAIMEANRAPILITSVRRSISSLAGAGLLVKTDSTQEGPWGALEHVWELRA